MPNNNDIYLPVGFHRMSAWSGLRPATRDCLRSMLVLAASRPGGVSIAERALLVACDFWSAAVSGSLIVHLGAEPADRLRSLANIYAAIGARQAARIMGIAACELAGSGNDRQCQRLIAALELALLKKRAIVDETINRLAQRLLPQPPVRAPRPAVAMAAALEERVAGRNTARAVWAVRQGTSSMSASSGITIPATTAATPACAP